MRKTVARRAVLGGLAAAAFTPCVACAAPRPNPWPRWNQSDEHAKAVVDHSAWTAFLARYLAAGPDGINRMAYGRVTPGDRSELGLYIDRLAGLPITSYARAEQRAYWINLYNALTLRTVLEHYPVSSILDITLSAGLVSRGPWGRKLLHIEGEEVSLDDIEHRILRPFWRDPRLHYALNCAALGCPNLQPRAFTAALTEDTLDTAAIAYVNHPRGARLVDGGLYVSSIYVWYHRDFGDSDRAVITHLRRYATPPFDQALALLASIAGDSYDWSLNDAGMA